MFLTVLINHAKQKNEQYGEPLSYDNFSKFAPDGVFDMSVNDFNLALEILEIQKLIATHHSRTGLMSITLKGVKLYLDGGFSGTIKETQRKKYLYIIGQISLAVAGAYYLIEFIKDLPITLINWYK